jgi:hypothetical protein
MLCEVIRHNKCRTSSACIYVQKLSFRLYNHQIVIQAVGNVQARLASELEQHRVRLLSVFDNLHSRIMDAKTLAAAACKPVSQQDKVSSHFGLCFTCSCTCLCTSGLHNALFWQVLVSFRQTVLAAVAVTSLYPLLCPSGQLANSLPNQQSIRIIFFSSISRSYS